MRTLVQRTSLSWPQQAYPLRINDFDDENIFTCFFNRYLHLRVNDEFKSISYFCDVYLGGFIEILSVSSIFTHIFFSIKIHSTPKSHFKSDQNLGERCLLQCNTDFLDCTKDCDNEPSERECLQECNRTVVACSNGLFTDPSFFLVNIW